MKKEKKKICETSWLISSDSFVIWERQVFLCTRIWSYKAKYRLDAAYQQIVDRINKVGGEVQYTTEDRVEDRIPLICQTTKTRWEHLLLLLRTRWENTRDILVFDGRTREIGRRVVDCSIIIRTPRFVDWLTVIMMRHTVRLFSDMSCTYSSLFLIEKLKSITF